MSCKNVEMSSRAFTKLQLHLAKYPHCSVNGLLLACSERFKQDHVLEIVDVIPLFHQCLQLTPMLEIALTHVDSHCNINELCVAGYYEAPEHLKAKVEPSAFSVKIADKIHSNFAESKLIIVDNRSVPKLDSLHIYSKGVDGKWKKTDGNVDFEQDASDVLQHLLDSGVYRNLVDFDNHLCDISQHWLNHPINQLVHMK